MAINYIHPSVSSTITDNSTTYITASGTTKLFAAFTSEKGIDNEIKMITSASEYIFNYGEPNMKYYGQTGYNILNWLDAGGVVYCLRVLPEDAGYANAIVNIQTKESTKEVLDVNGNIVNVPDVTLRHTIVYTNASNTSATAITEFKDLWSGTSKTADGFTNNMIFAVIPKGRGKGYNDLGFRIYRASGYDSTYEFQLYNFEVTKTSESGVTSVIQGPFIVALDPDAMSLSGSSFFITDVISNYCDYFDVIFNEKNYEQLAAIINPYVHPNRIDFFNGETRKINDKLETYYDPVTNKEEDIHMSIIKYFDYQPTDSLNIVDADDSIEDQIVNIDNAYRTNEYNEKEARFERAKVALSKIKRIAAGGSVDDFKNIPVENFEAKTLDAARVEYAADTTLDSDYATFDAAQQASMPTSPDVRATKEAYDTVNAKMTPVVEGVEKTLRKIEELYDFTTISFMSYPELVEVATEVLANLKLINTRVDVVRIKSINCNRYISEMADIIAEFNSLGDKPTNVEKEEFIASFLENVSGIMEAAANISDAETYYYADKVIADINATLEVIMADYATITDEYVTVEEYNLAMADAWLKIKTLCDNYDVKFAIELALLENKAVNYKAVVTEEYIAAKTAVINLLNSVMGYLTSISYEDAKLAVDNVKEDVAQGIQDTYIISLHNFDSFVALKYGSDGAIEDVPFGDDEVTKLLVKAYKGYIDDTLADKDRWPIDMVLDANYPSSVKSAIITLCTKIRDDFMGILDTGFKATPQDAIDYKKSAIDANNFRIAIFTQHFVVPDDQYTVSNIEVTPTYYLSSKIPANDNAHGIQWNFVGPRRGTISGFKKVSFLPNAEWREQLYNNKVNYVQQDQVSTRFNSQLTSQSTMSALSNISCVRTLLRIQREVEDLMKDFQFEFNDNATLESANAALSGYLTQWVTNRACSTISGSVYASDYDRQQKLMRVKIELSFTNIIERIAIDLVVNS